VHVCTIAFLPPPVLLPSCCASSSSSCSPSFSFCFFVLLHANCFLTHVRFFLVAVVAIVGFRFFLVVVLLFLRWVIFFEVSGYSFPLNSSLLIFLMIYCFLCWCCWMIVLFHSLWFDVVCCYLYEAMPKNGIFWEKITHTDHPYGPYRLIRMGYFFLIFFHFFLFLIYRILFWNFCVDFL